MAVVSDRQPGLIFLMLRNYNSTAGDSGQSGEAGNIMVMEHFIHCLLAYQGACPRGVGGTQEDIFGLFRGAYPTRKHSLPRYKDKRCHAGT